MPVTDQDLSDLVDGRLDPEREHEVMRVLGERPELARRHSLMAEQDRMLRRLGEEVLAEPVPEGLIAVLREAEARGPLRREPVAAGGPDPPPTPAGWRTRTLAFASGLSLALGLILGWLAHVGFGPPEVGLFRDVIRQAALSHQVLAVAGRQKPLENLADSDVLPVTDLPRLFGAPVRAPTLAGSDWTPVGLKTETGSAGNAMQIAYADPEGQVVTLFIRPVSEVHDMPVNLVEADGYDVLYWVDGPLIYALVGEPEEDALADLARRIYASRATGGTWSPAAVPTAAPPDGTQR